MTKKKSIERLSKKSPGGNFVAGGQDDDSASDDDISLDDCAGEGMEMATSSERTTAGAKLAALRALKDSQEPAVEFTGVFGLNFMKMAIEKQRMEAAVERDDMIREIEEANETAKDAALRARDDYDTTDDRMDSGADEEHTNTTEGKKTKGH